MQDTGLPGKSEACGDQGIFIMDEELRCAFVNASGAAMLHREQGGIIGRTLGELLPRATFDCLKPFIPLALEADDVTDTARSVEFCYDRRWLLITLERLHVGDGQRKVLSCVLRDVTDWKTYKDALKLDEARLEALLQLTDIQGMTVQDITQFALDRAIELTGSQIGLIRLVSPDEKITEIYSVSGDVMKSWNMGREHMFFAVSDGGIWTEPFRTRKPVIINDYASAGPMKKGLPAGHGMLKNLLMVPILDHEHVRLLAMVANKGADYDEPDVRQLTLLMSGVWRIIARARAEEQLREAKMRAELYVDVMSHDISNMNQIAMGYLELAGQVLVTDPGTRYMIDRPMAAIQTTARIIGDVRKIQLARSGTLKIEPMDACGLIDTVADSFRDTDGRQIAIRRSGEEHCHVMANGLLLDVFENIMGNSVKHSADSLEIDVDVSKKQFGGRYYAVITVEDNGPGIPDDFKEKIARRTFYSGGGINRKGLGLYLVMTLVESYDGRVQVEDRIPGDYTKGVRTVIVLPLADMKTHGR